MVVRQLIARRTAAVAALLGRVFLAEMLTASVIHRTVIVFDLIIALRSLPAFVADAGIRSNIVLAGPIGTRLLCTLISIWNVQLSP